MTDLRQAAQQALEALIDAANVLSAPMFADAVDALKAALEQQAEPVAWMYQERGDEWITTSYSEVENENDGVITPLYTTPPQRQLDKTSFNAWWDGDYDDSENRFEQDSAAYWAWAGWQAAQRPWVGLTDEEIEAVVEQVANGKLVGTVQEFRIRFSRAIEAKLKERNT